MPKGGTSSARPDNLDHFSKRGATATRKLQSDLTRLTGLYNAFLDENKWGTLDANSLLGAYGRHINGNGFTVRWVARIAEAFRAAGGDGRLVRLPDRAIKASLRAAGLDRHRKSVTFDGPIAYGDQPTTGYTNDPVNTASGNFVEFETDLAFGGLVASLTFKRTYNSRSDRIGPFGRGWSSWATARLVHRPDGAEYVSPDGQEASFPRMGDGYGRNEAVAATVEPLESGLALNWFGGARWTFDEAGRPVSVSDGPGTEVSLRHDRDGRLVELVHAGGKRVDLRWDVEGERIVGVECSDGRAVAYRYDESDNLVEVDGERGTRRYELNEHARIRSVTDADGVVELVNTYDDDGRVLQQLSPFGRLTHISYLPGRVTVTMDDDEDGPVNTYIHDPVGRLIAVVDGDDQQLSMSYDEWGNIASLTERNGAVTVQEYDERARPLRRVLPTGATLMFAHDDRDRLVEVAVSSGAVTRYRYEGDERMPAEIVDAEGGVTRQTIRGGVLRQAVDPDGVTVDVEYDGDGNVVATTDGEGNTTHLERDEAGRLIATVSPLGRRTTYFYDARGHLVERHEADGGVWRYEYTSAGRIFGVTDPTGARTETRYGEHGSPVATIDPLGHVTTSEYDVFGNVVAVASAGSTWRYAYDALMRLTVTVDPLGERWEREYDVNGTLVVMRAPDGVTARTSLDAVGRVVGIDDGLTSVSLELDELDQVVAQRRPDGTGRRIEFDLCGRGTLIEDATGAITRLEYTPAGRIARVLYPSDRVDSFEYSASGRLAAVIDGAGRRWELRHDADGAPVERVLPSGETERIEYDEGGRPRRLSVPGEGETRYEYDPAGRVIGVADRDAGARTFEYDAAGRLAVAIDANGATTRYVHDEAGRPLQSIDPLGGTFTRRYDAAGRVVELVDQLGRRATVAYNAAGRIVELVDGSGRDARLTYDVSGRMTSMGPANRTPSTVEYDALGRMVGLQEPGSPPNTLGWDAEGRLVERARGDLVMRWAYDADGERSAIGYPDGSRTSYTRDAGGYVVAALHPALGTIELRRDAVGRLVGANADGMRALWRYEDGDLAQYEMDAGGKLRSAHLMRDPLGRVVQATIDDALHAFVYDDAGQLMSATTPAGAYVFAYDSGGRLQRETSPAGVSEYEYDVAGQLVARSDVGGDVTRFEYDAAGRRLREAGPGVDRRYEWDHLGRLAAVEYSGSDGADPRSMQVSVDALGELAAIGGQALLWDSAHPFSPLTWDGQGAVVGEGVPWALASGSTTQWLAPDWQGTIGDAARDPWGAVVGGASGGLDAHLGYRGELELGSDVWLRHRIYHPEARSFAQPDLLPPVPGTAAAANPYHYASNDPLGRLDPLGLRPVTEEELKAIRHKMDRNLFESAAAHAGDVSMVTGVLALAVLPFFPPAAAVLGGISMATSGMAAYDSAVRGDWTDFAVDIVGVGAGGAAIRLASKAKALKNLAAAHGVDEAAAVSAAGWARSRGLEGLGKLNDAQAAALRAAGIKAKTAASLAKVDELALTVGGTVMGTGYWVYDNLVPKTEPPGCEPPKRPKPMRVPSFNVR